MTGTGSRATDRALAGVLAGSLAALVLAVVAHPAPPSLDTGLHGWLLDHRDPALTSAAVVVTTSGTGAPAYALAALAGVLAAPSRRWRGALVAVAALAGGQGIRLALATLVGRERPPVRDWAWHAGGPSLPSGHTTTSALVAGLFLLALTGHRDRSRARALAMAAVVLWAVAVGLTRAYLGVHWPTDVLAGWLLAATLVLSVPRSLVARLRAGPATPS